MFFITLSNDDDIHTWYIPMKTTNTDCPRVVVRISGNDIAQAASE